MTQHIEEREDGTRRVTISFAGDPGKTQQHFRDDANINILIKRFLKGKAFPMPDGMGLYGDFSNVPDYQTAQMLLLNAQSQFDALPSSIRNRFNNKPAELVAWVADPDNLDEARDLGLLPQAPKDGEGALAPATPPGAETPPAPPRGEATNNNVTPPMEGVTPTS